MLRDQKLFPLSYKCKFDHLMLKKHLLAKEIDMLA